MDTYENKIKGMMGAKDLMWLYNIAQKMNSIVEIGCWSGKSTHALLSGCKGTVYAVDHWIGSSYSNLTKGEKEIHDLAISGKVFDKFKRNVGHFKNLKIHKMESMKAVKKFKNKSVDMVFIDGCHRYKDVCDDIKGWLPKTRKLICGHDIAHGPVKKAVDELIGEHELTEQNIWFKWL